MENPRTERITMRHPKIETTARTTRAAFDQIHSKKGWEIVDVPAAVATEALGTEVQNLGALSREDLDTVAEGLGIDPSTFSNKGALVEHIETTLKNKE
jgi:hypothetical protein